MKDSRFRKYLDKVRPSFEAGGALSWLHSFYEAVDSFVSVPSTTTSGGSHIRDCIDLKRIMLCVVVSLLPCFAVACVSNGFITMLKLLLVSIVVGYAVELLSSQLRGKPLCEGYAVTGLIIPMIVPADVPLWALALAVAFAVIVGKEAFGGTGMNIWNPAMLAKAFIVFGFPSLAGNCTAAVEACSAAWLTAVGFGALLLVITGTASWKVMLSSLAGAFLTAVVVNPAAGGADITAFGQLSLGSLAFGMVFMATDPVTGAQTEAGKWICGFLTGVLAIVIRSLELADADGTMSAILLMNTIAPIVDRCVISANITSRQRRNLTV